MSLTAVAELVAQIESDIRPRCEAVVWYDDARTRAPCQRRSAAWIVRFICSCRTDLGLLCDDHMTVALDGPLDPRCEDCKDAEVITSVERI